MKPRVALRVAHFNTHIGGGAAIAARRLHGSLVAMGIESRFYHYSGRSPDPTYHALGPVLGLGPIGDWANNIFRKADRWRMRALLIGQPNWVELFSFPKAAYRLRWSDLAVVPDVVHLHWTAGFFDLPTWFASIPKSVPIVWTMHDMNPFTGGCHYSGSCREFERSCGHCPQLARPGPDDYSHRNLGLKLDLLASRSVHIVADSLWLEREARTSTAFKNVCSARTIHYGLDHEIFRPKEKQSIRKALDIADNTFVIAFGADSLRNPRKGLAVLLAALRQVNSKNVLLLTFGNGKLVGDTSELRVIQIGAISGEERLADIYSAADLFVLPSLQEAFGQTALESMACGTPVVGFDVGGIPDMVVPTETGLLAQPGNAADLAEKIDYMITHPDEARRMGLAARKRVEQQFTLQHQAGAYMDLYASLTD